ncbi:PqqD family protein [Streptomyces cyaneofuscatus]|uniref:PqqD family protein n=1 Tax=Streptomyces cyaneofuscatus TaxID=66883 RepID=UPI0033AF70E1
MPQVLAGSVAERRLDVRVRNVRGVIRIAVPDGAFDLSETAAFIWRRLDGTSTAADLGAQLAAEYDVSVDEAVSDTIDILEEWAAQGAIEVTDPS